MKVSHDPESQTPRKIGFFWEMVSGLCFSIERRAFRRNGLIIVRHSTELHSRISDAGLLKMGLNVDASAHASIDDCTEEEPEVTNTMAQRNRNGAA